MRIERSNAVHPAPASPAKNATALVGNGPFRYRAEAPWGALPDGWTLVEVAGVATDSADNVLVFNRGAHPVIVFDRQGKFLRSWGEGVFTRPHGIHIGPDDAVYCTDDADHTVRKFSPEGRLLLTLGASGRGSNTGAATFDYRTIAQAAGPFNLPTNLALAGDGAMFVVDGYGNARVHRFSPDGRLVASWGEPGAGPGQFHVPHGICIDSSGTIFVADRENSRLQLFSPTGEFLAEWTDVARPCEVAIDRAGNVFVAELGYRTGMFPGNAPPLGNPPGGRLSIFDSAGRLQCRIGGGDNPCSPGDFFAPHDVWLDSRGDAYVGEVIVSSGGPNSIGARSGHALQKLVRLEDSPAP